MSLVADLVNRYLNGPRLKVEGFLGIPSGDIQIVRAEVWNRGPASIQIAEVQLSRVTLNRTWHGRTMTHDFVFDLGKASTDASTPCTLAGRSRCIFKGELPVDQRDAEYVTVVLGTRRVVSAKLE